MQLAPTPSGQFQDGDPFANIQGTVITAAWLNSMQAEVTKVIQAAGIALDSSKTDQLYMALQALFAPAANITQPLGDRSTKTATDRFVADALGAWVLIDISGNQNVVLQQAQYGCAVLVLLGVLTGHVAVILPAQGDQHKVVNKTSGAFQVTIRAATGSGVVVPRGGAQDVFFDGADIRTSAAATPGQAGIIFYMAGAA